MKWYILHPLHGLGVDAAVVVPHCLPTPTPPITSHTNVLVPRAPMLYSPLHHPPAPGVCRVGLGPGLSLAGQVTLFVVSVRVPIHLNSGSDDSVSYEF